MADAQSTALQARAKTQVTKPAEPTKPGPVFTPVVDIFETDEEITLLADMPGAKTDGMNIDLRENTLTLDADVGSPEGPDEADVLREYRTGKYFRQFILSQVIDQGKIRAELKEGVLRLSLPKVEAAKPRKINVRSS